MQKDFDKWNTLKQYIEKENKDIYSNIGEIWWCSLGINIGSESCGKNNFFERSVLIMKVFNVNLLLVAPLTTKHKNIYNHIELNINNRRSFIMTEQIKVISSKRLSRKIDRISKVYLEELFIKINQLLLQSKSPDKGADLGALRPSK